MNPLLKALSLPGSDALLRLGCAEPIRNFIGGLGKLTSRVGLMPEPAVNELWRAYSSLGDADTRHDFLRTLRAVIDQGGQAVSATNRLHLAAQMPTLIVWGDSDPIIPVHHAFAAHDAIEGSRLEIFEGVGHFPHCEAPERFVTVMTEFIENTVPAHVTVTREHVVQEEPAAAAG